MDSLVNYDSDEDDQHQIYAPPPPNKRTKVRIETAPEIPVEEITMSNSVELSKKIQVSYNLEYDEMYKPTQGPFDMFSKPMENIKNTFTGYVEAVRLPSDHFETQRRTFNNYGYALDPSKPGSTREFVGDKEKAVKYKGATVVDDLPDEVKAVKAIKKRRLPKGDPSHVNGYSGPWAGYEDESTIDTRIVSAEEEERLKMEAEELMKKRLEGFSADGAEIVEASEYHGPEGFNYMRPPAKLELGSDSMTSMPPKKLLHSYTGHARGVNLVKFFPKTGHIVLSASMDTTVKLWDVYNDRNLLRTCSGHEKSVRDIQFNRDGTKFLSCSFDKYIKLWDTETGQCIERLITGDRIPYSARFHPENENVIFSGGADNKILQYDAKSKNITCTYQEHLGPVNALVFLDGGRRIVSSSDDKTMKLWQFNQATSLHTADDPTLHSMPTLAVHPEDEWIACQSMDNHILVFGASDDDKLKMHKNKRFSGHQTSGYACQMVFSPDGKFLMSGDSGGNYFVWNWKTGKQVRKSKAHNQVTIGCDWHPVEKNKGVTCSWDGLIKLWGGE